MKYKPDQEQALLEDILGFSHDPLGYVTYSYPWGMEGTPLAQSDGPRKWQAEFLTALSEHVKEQQFLLDNDMFDKLSVFQEVIASGRGIGKSALFGMVAQWMVDCHLGCTVQVTANTEAQLRSKTFPEFARWFTMSMTSHWWTTESLTIKPQEWFANMVREQLKIDTRYWGVSGQNWSEENPDAFAGTHNSYGLAMLYDESSGIAAPVWDVTQGFFTELNPFRIWAAFSNPRRNSGAFYDRFHKPEMLKYWKTRQIDARTVEGSDQRVYQQIIDTYGEKSDQARVEVYGQFPEAGESQFISNSAVRGAQDRELIGFDDTQPLIMGVDPAPRGRTVIRFRQGRDARSIKPIVLQNADNTQIVDAMVDAINKYDPDAIAVDAGQGTGVIDEAKRRKVRVQEVWFGGQGEGEEFATRGSELWGCIRDWLPGGCIDDSAELFRDLTVRTWQWMGREDGKKMLTPKKAMARDGIPSPDDGDALALTFAPKVVRRNKRVRGGSAPGGRPNIALDADYPIFGIR